MGWHATHTGGPAFERTWFVLCGGLSSSPAAQASESGRRRVERFDPVGFGPLLGQGRRNTVNDAPPPLRSVAVTVPPWADTMAPTIDRPRPAPPLWRDRDGSRPVEALEIRCGGPGGKPGTVVGHLHATRLAVPTDRDDGAGPRRSVGPDVGQRLSSTWRRRWGSA